MVRVKQTKPPANRPSIVCAYPGCTRVRIKRNAPSEPNRLPTRRRWCYLHFNGEFAQDRKKWAREQLKKQGKAVTARIKE